LTVAYASIRSDNELDLTPLPCAIEDVLIALGHVSMMQLSRFNIEKFNSLILNNTTGLINSHLYQFLLSTKSTLKTLCIARCPIVVPPEESYAVEAALPQLPNLRELMLKEQPIASTSTIMACKPSSDNDRRDKLRLEGRFSPEDLLKDLESCCWRDVKIVIDGVDNLEPTLVCLANELAKKGGFKLHLSKAIDISVVI
jgi:hypothetical protein